MANGILPENRALYGLVLVGGQSQRLGVPKANLIWRGEKLFHRARNLLVPFCSEVFISCREDQAIEFDPLPSIFDGFSHRGPMGGLHTAMLKHVGVSWMVLAVDLPLMTFEAVKFLVDHRDPSIDVTVFIDGSTHLQPLCAIYEYSVLPRLMKATQENDYSMHNLIMGSNFKALDWNGSPDVFMNVNTMQDWERVKSLE